MRLKIRKSLKSICGIAIILLFLYIFVFGKNSGVAKDIGNLTSYEVVHVSDGDTIIVKMSGREEKIRFLGVDTPEKNDERVPVQCFARSASNYVKKKLEGKRVSLLSDSLSDNRDKYGRLLRYVQIEGENQTVNWQLVSEGYAFAIRGFNYKYKQDFIDLESNARNKNLGLWGNCTFEGNNFSKNTINDDFDQSR